MFTINDSEVAITSVVPEYLVDVKMEPVDDNIPSALKQCHLNKKDSLLKLSINNSVKHRNIQEFESVPYIDNHTQANIPHWIDIVSSGSVPSLPTYSERNEEKKKLTEITQYSPQEPALIKYSYTYGPQQVLPENENQASKFVSRVETEASTDCDADLNQPINLMMELQVLESQLRCQMCSKSYPSTAALLHHDCYHHRTVKTHKCDVCLKTFSNNSHLIAHRRIHTGERPYQCPICARAFSDRSAFVRHERTHGPNGAIVKRYKCEVCFNDFVDSRGLKKHTRIHTGERPYVCQVCGKSYATSSTFVSHKRIHSGERPYKCECCDKSFITKSHLLTHRRVHSGEKPFTCSICARAFADGSSFRRHERLHTGENRYSCDVCGRSFPMLLSMQKHLQTHMF